MTEADRKAVEEIERMKDDLRALLEVNQGLDLKYPGDREVLLDGLMETIWMSMAEERTPAN